VQDLRDCVVLRTPPAGCQTIMNDWETSIHPPDNDRYSSLAALKRIASGGEVTPLCEFPQQSATDTKSSRSRGRSPDVGAGPARRVSRRSCSSSSRPSFTLGYSGVSPVRRPLRFLAAVLAALAGCGGIVRPSAASGRVRRPCPPSGDLGRLVLRSSMGLRALRRVVIAKILL
jgi:hypothetical protein